MKMLKCDLTKIALAALMLGVFSLSPLAKAGEDDDVPDSVRKGIKWSELRALSGNSFKIQVKEGMVTFQGELPKGCLADRSMSEIESGGGQHKLMIDLPKCPKGDASKLTGEDKKMKRVDVAFPAKAFSGEDGKFCLNWSTTGDENAECDPVMISKDGKRVQLEHVSESTLLANAKSEQDKKEAAERKAREEREAEALKNKKTALVAKLEQLCKSGDFVGFGAEIEAARSFLGDVTTLLRQLDGAKKTFLENAVKKAKAEDLKDAYETYLEAASANGWDTDEVTKTYIERRRDDVNSLIGSSDASASKKAAAIAAFKADLSEIDALRGNKATVSWLYGQLANKMKDAEDFDAAETYFERAVAEAPDNDTKVKYETDMAKMFLEARDACREKNKGTNKFAACDKLAKKADKHMGGAIAAKSKMKGDDNLDDLNAMKIERIQEFGMPGYAMNVPGYGIMNLSGGNDAVKKKQVFQQGQQEMYMQYMMRQNMGMGMGMNPSANGGSAFFR